MEIRGYRATFGDSHGAHDLISAASKIKLAAQTIQTFTDNARQQPSKFLPQPFYRGLPVNDYYILIKTYPDKTASRPGMVFSEALFYPLEEAISASDLSKLLSPFAETLEIAKKSKSSEFIIEFEVAETKSIKNTAPGLVPLLNAVANNDFDKPPVWIGQDNFVEVLIGFWNQIPESLRKTFSFRFCYVPQEFDRFPPLLIYTPSEMAGRWIQYNRIQPQAANETLQSKTAAYLLNQADGAEMKKFLSAIEVQAIDWQSLKMAEQCIEYLEKLNSNTITVSEFRGLLARIGILSPGENQGTEYKKEISEKFCRMNSIKASFDDIYALNTFTPLSFPKSSTQIVKSIKEWLENNFWTLSSEHLAKLLHKNRELGGGTWSESVNSAISEIINDSNEKKFSILWKWWQSDGEIFDMLQDYLPATKKTDSALNESCPKKLPRALGDAVKIFALKREFWQLCAAALSAYLPPSVAIKEQLRLEPFKTAKANSGLKVLFERLTLENILEEVLETADERLLQPLAQRLVKNIKLLSKIDLNLEIWQELALLMLENDATTFWRNLPKPAEKVYQILELLISGELVKEEIIPFIAESQFSNISDYPNRKIVWGHLPSHMQIRFLTATSEDWWKNFNKNADSGDIPEQPLLDYLWEDYKIERHLRNSKNSVEDLIKIYKIFPNLSEDYFVRKLYFVIDLNKSIDQVSAISLGKYVHLRRWRGCAKAILRRADSENRRDLFPALRECADLFYFYERWRSAAFAGDFDERLTWNDWWKGFMDLLFELYPDGPSQSNIWKKAGGHNSDLLKKVSGRDAWEDAIQKLHSGKAGSKINTLRLIEEIETEYSGGEGREKILLFKGLFFQLGGKY